MTQGRGSQLAPRNYCRHSVTAGATCRVTRHAQRVVAILPAGDREVLLAARSAGRLGSQAELGKPGGQARDRTARPFRFQPEAFVQHPASSTRQLDLDPIRIMDAPKVALWGALLKSRHDLDALRHKPNNGPAPL
jgi:hypothetical protein